MLVSSARHLVGDIAEAKNRSEIKMFGALDYELEITEFGQDIMCQLSAVLIAHLTSLFCKTGSTVDY
jgi:hypothetical protein